MNKEFAIDSLLDEENKIKAYLGHCDIGKAVIYLSFMAETLNYYENKLDFKTWDWHVRQYLALLNYEQNLQEKLYNI